MRSSGICRNFHELTREDIMTYVEMRGISMLIIMYPGGDGTENPQLVISNMAYRAPSSLWRTGRRVSLFDFIRPQAPTSMACHGMRRNFIDPFAEERPSACCAHSLTTRKQCRRHRVHIAQGSRSFRQPRYGVSCDGRT
jgi:hypothetical protein